MTLYFVSVQAIRNLLERESYHPGEHLFKSQKSGESLKVSSVHNLVKAWCKAIKLKGNHGSHTLRKTWGYHQRVTYRVDIPTYFSQDDSLFLLVTPTGGVGTTQAAAAGLYDMARGTKIGASKFFTATVISVVLNGNTVTLNTNPPLSSPNWTVP